MFDLFGTNQGKDPFKLGKQVSGRRAPQDQKKQSKNTMAVQTAGIFLLTSMNHFPLCVSIKKIQACKFFHCIGATHPAWFRSRNTVVNDKISLICGYLEIYVIYVCVYLREIFCSGRTCSPRYCCYCCTLPPEEESGTAAELV